MKYLVSLISILVLTISGAYTQDCPGNITIWTVEDDLEYSSLDTVKKLEYIENILATDDKMSPDDMAFLNFKKSQALYHNARYNEALVACNVSLGLFEKCGEYHYQQGLNMLNVSDFIDAIRLFSSAMKLGYDEWLCLKSRSHAKLALNDYKGALKDCELMAAIFADSAKVIEAEIYIEKGDFKQAEYVLHHLSEKEAHTGHTYFLLSICAAKQKKMSESAKYYAESAKLDSKFADPHIIQGIEEYLEGNTRAACEVWQHASTVSLPLAISYIQQYCGTK
jgi:tetratricopeptide (TPR) repeat protein